ncbi:MAG: hypothetical protein NHB15_09405 [Methanosarcina barkeri]|nr:hypothetical protein [Methanosarcina sp. ERenArc_MAG2]
MKFIKTILKIFIFVASFFVSVIALILPWKLRKIYLSLIGSASLIVLSSSFIMDLVNEYAFARESDPETLLRKD